MGLKTRTPRKLEILVILIGRRKTGAGIASSIGIVYLEGDECSMIYYRCSDRMCGARDCPTCNPGNFVGGVYFEDLPCEECGEKIGDEGTWGPGERTLCNSCISSQDEPTCIGCGGAGEHEGDDGWLCDDCLNKRLQVEAVQMGDYHE